MPILALPALTVGLCTNLPQSTDRTDVGPCVTPHERSAASQDQQNTAPKAVHRSTRSAVAANTGAASAHRRFVHAPPPEHRSDAGSPAQGRPSPPASPDTAPRAVHRSTRSAVGANTGAASAHRRFVHAPRGGSTSRAPGSPNLTPRLEPCTDLPGAPLVPILALPALTVGLCTPPAPRASIGRWITRTRPTYSPGSPDCRGLQPDEGLSTSATTSALKPAEFSSQPA